MSENTERTFCQEFVRETGKELVGKTKHETNLVVGLARSESGREGRLAAAIDSRATSACVGIEPSCRVFGQYPNFKEGSETVSEMHDDINAARNQATAALRAVICIAGHRAWRELANEHKVERTMGIPYDTRLPPDLRAIKQEIEDYARSYGLDFYNTIFEVVEAEDLNEIAAYGGIQTRSLPLPGYQRQEFDPKTKERLGKALELTLFEDQKDTIGPPRTMSTTSAKTSRSVAVVARFAA